MINREPNTLRQKKKEREGIQRRGFTEAIGQNKIKRSLNENKLILENPKQVVKTFGWQFKHCETKVSRTEGQPTNPPGSVPVDKSGTSFSFEQEPHGPRTTRPEPETAEDRCLDHAL